MFTRLLTRKTGISKRKADTILFVVSLIALSSSFMIFRVAYGYQTQGVDFVERIEKASISR